MVWTRWCWVALASGVTWIGTAGAWGAQIAPSRSRREPLRVDASAPPHPTGPADYEGGTNRSPDGSVLGVTDRYLTLDGEPWLPVIGEMHYTRVPEADWEDEILKMKSSGVNIISTYVIWIHHEEVEGQWDWSGQRDLRHFSELCRKHGMLLVPRIGPWAHAEVRNGGLPDWVIQAGPVRQMDPKFMAETQAFYQEIGRQLHGQLWKDGGPVIGVQLENEYAMRGPGKGEEYILALKKMAIASGMDVPLYTVTGWDNAVVPAHEVLPVYGGYPDAPWGSSRKKLAPQEVYAFRFHSRVSGSMGMIGPSGEGDLRASAVSAMPVPRTPFLTGEIGGGIEDTYHRRPVVDADDIAAMMPVMLGSGVNGYGSYMFHGGENPDGKLSTLQESQATHYPTDVPEKSYDFQAPIGEFGLERRSLRILKNWNYFLDDFGSLLAPMPAFAPEIVPRGPKDLKVLRWSVRTDGHAGFLFVNNHVRDARMPNHPQTQFKVTLSGGSTRTIPETPVTIPSGVYFAWPFGLDLSGVPLRYATAQLMARLPGSAGETFVFACVRGVRCELALESTEVEIDSPAGLRKEHVAGATLVIKTAGSDDDEHVDVRTKSGATVHLLLLSATAAEESWRLPGEGAEHLLRTRADVFGDSDRVMLRQLGSVRFRFCLYPASSKVGTTSATVTRGHHGEFVATVPKVSVNLEAKQIRPAARVGPVAIGPALNWRPVGVAEAPRETVWAEDAADWTVRLRPAGIPEGVANLFLRISYAGDAARLSSERKLLDDNFFNGEAWLVGLRCFAVGGYVPPLELQILPMRSDAPVYLPSAAQAHIATKGQTAKLQGISVIPQYKMWFLWNGHVLP